VRSYVRTVQGPAIFASVVVDGSRALAYVGDGVPGDPTGSPPMIQAWFKRAVRRPDPGRPTAGGNLWAPPLLAGSTIAEVGDRFDGDQLGDDPRASWASAAQQSTAAVGDAGALARTVHVSFGDISGEEYVSQLVFGRGDRRRLG
jgi:hypothetical protein